MASKEITISKTTVRRLASDIRQLIKSPLDSHGIYYEHSDNNLLLGRALIIGAKDTPYEGGYYFFQFDFPASYPHSPPKVTFMTNGLDNIRIHPNLYKNGKTCLSVLNTWYGKKVGDQWSGCQTISSILLTLSSILTQNPILHEPGISKSHEDFETYTTIVEYINIKLGMIEILTKQIIKTDFKELYSIACDDLNKNKVIKYNILEKLKKKFINTYGSLDIKNVATNIYRNDCLIDYKKLTNLLDDAINDNKIELKNK